MSKAVFKAEFTMYLPEKPNFEENQSQSKQILAEMVEKVEVVLKEYAQYGEAKYKLDFTPGIQKPKEENESST